MQPSLLSYLRKLRNHEFAEAYELICDNLTVDGLDETADSNVIQALERVEDYARELPFLKNLKRKHHITPRMDEYKKARHQYLLSFRGRINYYMKSPIESERATANLLNIWLSGYQEFFSGATIHSQSRLVSNICDETESDESLEQSVSELNLTATFNEIRSITSRMRVLHLARLKQKKEDSARAKLIRKTAMGHIITLWKTLEVSAALDTLDAEVCKTLFEKINWVIIDFKARYLGKNTRRENEKLKEEQEGELPETETDPEPETT